MKEEMGFTQTNIASGTNVVLQVDERSDFLGNPFRVAFNRVFWNINNGRSMNSGFPFSLCFQLFCRGPFIKIYFNQRKEC